jgi:hypothetical protein
VVPDDDGVSQRRRARLWVVPELGGAHPLSLTAAVSRWLLSVSPALVWSALSLLRRAVIRGRLYLIHIRVLAGTGVNSFVIASICPLVKRRIHVSYGIAQYGPGYAS